jgi:hypothetical protein
LAEQKLARLQKPEVWLWLLFLCLRRQQANLTEDGRDLGQCLCLAERQLA